MKITLVFVYVIFVSRLCYIYKMIAYLMPIYRIIVKILTRANGHATIDLTRIGTDNLSTDLISKSCGKRRLSTCSGPKYGYHFRHLPTKIIKKSRPTMRTACFLSFTDSGCTSDSFTNGCVNSKKSDSRLSRNNYPLTFFM